jgi:ankyrin repeat protein
MKRCLFLVSLFIISLCCERLLPLLFVRGDDLYNAVYVANFPAVESLLAILDSEVLSSRLPPDVNKTHGEYNRTSLMICGIDPQHYESDPVDTSCSKIAEAMIAKKVDIHHKDTKGWDALTFGVSRGFLKYSEVLLRHGADVNSIDSDEKTPLMKSIANGHAALSLLLIERGARLDKKDNNSLTALHFCSQIASINSSFIDVMKIMLKISPNELINGRDLHGRTPLMHAAILSETDTTIVDLLVKSGADPTLTDNFGQTAASLSKETSFKIRQYLAVATAAKIEQDHLKWLASTNIIDDDDYSESESIENNKPKNNNKKRRKKLNDEL